MTVSCSGIFASGCPDSSTGTGLTTTATCTWTRRLCVSCYQTGSDVYMRVQTNGLPNHCYSVLNTERVKTTVIDYSVKFNIAAPTTGLKTYTSQTAFDNEACLSTKSKLGTSSPHTLCSYTKTTLASSITP
jgi:hypothetical protein